jgi:hypothetical protein
MRKVLERLEPVRVDEQVEDGTHLDKSRHTASAPWQGKSGTLAEEI